MSAAKNTPAVAGERERERGATTGRDEEAENRLSCACEHNIAAHAAPDNGSDAREATRSCTQQAHTRQQQTHTHTQMAGTACMPHTLFTFVCSSSGT